MNIPLRTTQEQDQSHQTKKNIPFPTSEIQFRTLSIITAKKTEDFVKDKIEGVLSGNTTTDKYFYHSDHLGSASWITDGTGTPVQHLQYTAWGEPLLDQRLADYNERYTFSGKERDEETGLNYFGFRYLLARLRTWTGVDPLSDKYPSTSPYAYCGNNPVMLVDPDGRKDKPFDKRKDKPISIIPGTETPVFIYRGKLHKDHMNAYNCHSYAWHDSEGDRNPAEGDVPIMLPKWDNNPADDIIEQKARQMDTNENNIPGDIVIYYTDQNNNGQYDNKEEIHHSAIVKTVDNEGNTTTVISKMGQDGISENHPCAPEFYDTDSNGNINSRAYFRLHKNEK